MFNVFSFFSPFKFKIFFVFLGLKYEHSNLNVILSIDSQLRSWERIEMWAKKCDFLRIRIKLHNNNEKKNTQYILFYYIIARLYNTY